jgi:hypothetical protein
VAVRLFLVVDCTTLGCRGERTFAIADLATFYARPMTIGDLLHRIRCQVGVVDTWLETGLICLCLLCFAGPSHASGPDLFSYQIQFPPTPTSAADAAKSLE